MDHGFFFQAEDGIRDAQESRGLGDVYKRQALRDGQILVDPVVTVTIVEYFSRPISVMGAVRKPATFQALSLIHI